MVSSIIDLSEMRSLSSSLLTSLPGLLHGHCNTPEPPPPGARLLSLSQAPSTTSRCLLHYLRQQSELTLYYPEYRLCPVTTRWTRRAAGGNFYVEC